VYAHTVVRADMYMFLNVGSFFVCEVTVQNNAAKFFPRTCCVCRFFL
jgi:hypothetical protein